MNAKHFGSMLLALAACGDNVTPGICDDVTSGEACRFAGTGDRGFNGANPAADRLDSQLYYPIDLTFGPDGRAYIDDFNNHMIRRVEKDGTLRVVVGTQYEGDSDPEMADRLPVCAPAGAIGTDVAMNHPTDVKFGPDGMLWIAAWHNNKIRILDPDSGMEHTYAGNFYGYKGDGGQACSAAFNQPKTMVWGDDGSMYFIDQRNVRLRKVAPDGTLSTIAGNGQCSIQVSSNLLPPGCVYADIGDGAAMAQATFGWDKSDTPIPSGALAISGSTMFIADSANHRIRRVDLETGIVDCLANKDALPGYDGDGGSALDAHFNWPQDLEIGPDGRLYVADVYNNAIRAIDLNTMIVTTVAGGTECQVENAQCPDRALAKEIGLYRPTGIAFDADRAMYIADSYNNRILRVAP